MVVVLDVSVLIPLALPASRSVHLLRRLQAAGWQVALSEPILNDVGEKLRTKASLRKWLALSDDKIEEFLSQLPALGALMRDDLAIENIVKADPDDDVILATARAAHASYIVSEDRHLLDLKVWQGIRILNRIDFQAELDRLGVP